MLMPHILLAHTYARQLSCAACTCAQSDAYPMPEADVPMLPAVRAAMAAMAAGADTASVAAAANRATGAAVGAGLAAAAHKTHT